jgi:hypothetical protein
MHYLRLSMITATLVCGVASCKWSGLETNDEQKLSSLDNFAAGKTVTVNQCSGDSGLDYIGQEVSALIDGLQLIEAPSDFRDELAKALTSVPSNLLNVFFSTGNRIIVSKLAFDGKPQDNLSDCKLARASGLLLDQANQIEESPELASCVVLERGKDNQMRLGVYIQENVKAIRHNLVRRISQSISMHLAKLTTNAKGELEIGDEIDEGFAQWQAEMVQAIDSDVKKLASVQTQNYRELQSNLSAARFSHFAFAESMDSYYCSKQSREKMKKTFPMSFAKFAVLDQELQTLWSDGTSNESAGSLNLRGRRRGILRNVGRRAFVTTRVVGRAAINTGRGAVRVGAGVVRGTARVAKGATQVIARTGKAVLNGGARVIGGVGRTVGKEVQFRRKTGYIFPRMRGFRRR